MVENSLRRVPVPAQPSTEFGRGMRVLKHAMTSLGNRLAQAHSVLEEAERRGYGVPETARWLGELEAQLAVANFQLWQLCQYRLTVPTVDTFPIGWYGNLGMDPASVADMATNRVNVVLAYNRGGAEQHAAYLDQVALHGLCAIVQVVIDGPYNPAQVEELITRLRDRPEIWAWYLADEPDGGSHLPAEDAAAAYQQVKSLDPTRRIALAFSEWSSLGVVDSYASAMDIYMPDIYPVFKSSNEFESPALNDYFTKLTTFSAHAQEMGKAFWPVLQAFEADPDYPEAHRLPTFLEERYLIYAAIQARATGVFFFDYYLAPPHWSATVLAANLEEFEKYAESFAAGPLGVLGTSDPQTTATIYRDTAFSVGAFFILLVVHHGPDTKAVDIPLGDTHVDAPAVIVNSADRPLPDVREGKFRETFGPYEVRIYRFGLKPSIALQYRPA